jgi:hypothetical protein
VYDVENIDRYKFVYSIIKEDWETLKYMASIGLIDSIISGISNKNKKINLIIA